MEDVRDPSRVQVQERRFVQLRRASATVAPISVAPRDFGKSRISCRLYQHRLAWVGSFGYKTHRDGGHIWLDGGKWLGY